MANIENKLLVSLICNAILVTMFLWLSGIFGPLFYVFWMLIYGSVLYVLYGIFQKLKKEDFHPSKQGYILFLHHFFHRGSLLLLIVIACLGIFSYYQNEISPAPMPRYTLSNGEKTLVFQGMSHIASKKFYEDVAFMISEYKTKGYVLFFEGVRGGNTQNEQNFDKALGVKFDKDTYASLSKVYGLVNQNNWDFLGLINALDFNIDVSIDQIMAEYDKIKTPQSQNPLTGSTPIDAGEAVVKKLSHLGDHELLVLQYFYRGLINAIIKSEGVQSSIYDNFANKDLFQVILHNRNEVLAHEIESSKYQRIVTIYGLLHFQGVFQILKDNDVRWRIQKIDYTYPIR